jgi:oxalate---CoA ligase
VSDRHDQITIGDVVRRHAAASPDAPALVAEGRPSLSYGALAALMDRLQFAINGMGLGRQDRIAIVHPSNSAMAAIVMGVWSCATAAPMNPDFTVGEFTIHMRDLGVKAVIVAADADTPARAAAAHLGLPVIEIESREDQAAGMVEIRPGPTGEAAQPGPAQPLDLALVLTTSGTTSRSKVVPVRHRQLSAMSDYAAQLFELTAEDRCLNLMPLFHGHGLYSSLAGTLYSGGSLINLPDFSSKAFFRILVTLQPTWYSGSYTFHHTICAQASNFQTEIEQANLRFSRTASGHLDAEIADALEAVFGVPVIQTYSMTETGRISGNPQPPKTRKRGTVGISAGGEIAIIDPDGTVLPAGERGEIVARGPHVFEGYENDLDANAEAFIDGWFRTGDEGVFDEDGYLTLTGRIKEFINRGGEKIAPAEVDEALMRHPDVITAVAFPVPHVTLGQDVAAAVVSAKGAALTDEILNDHLRGRVANFKLPRRYVFVDDIPKGPTGKFERRKLAADFGLVREGPSPDAMVGAPERRATPLEAKLQRLWAETLELDTVSLDDDFFMLGGDSLQAVDLFLRIEQELDRKLPRSILFEAATVAKMAHHIDGTIPPQCVVAIQEGGERPPFFCIHDGNGQVLNYRELAGHLGDAQPFYGIQCLGLDGEDVPFVRIDEMAAHYVREIRKVQPVGPYYLGGYSFGGRVAYMMAQQLRAAGEEIAFLGLIDSYCHTGQRRIGPGQWFARHMDRVRALRTGQIPAYLGMRIRNSVEMAFMAVRLRLFSAAWAHYERRGRDIPLFLRRPVEANDIIRRDYEAQPYDGAATLFKAELYAWNHPNAHDGWHDLVKGGLEIRPIPGRHFEIVKPPHVETLARELSDCLNRAQANAMDSAVKFDKAS